MKRSFFIASLLSSSLLLSAQNTEIIDVVEPQQPISSQQQNINSYDEEVLKENYDIRVSVIGQGVAPMHTASPAQAFALAKRAAIADGYRLIAEKIKGVKVDGQDTIKNMMVTRSTVRTYVQAMVKNANIVETNFKDGLCEVEMEIVISYSQFAQ